jgi:hypothetical protein
MRFRLRTLLIVMMLAGPLVGLAWRWRASKLGRSELQRIQAENERWRREAIRSAPVRNLRRVPSAKTRQEFLKRFGYPWPDGPLGPEPAKKQDRLNGKSGVPPWVYIPPGQYDDRP